MSDKVGPIAVLPSDANGPFFPGTSETSADTQRLIDEEVRRLVEESPQPRSPSCSQNTVSTRQPQAQALLKAETLDAKEATPPPGVPMRPAEQQPAAPVL